MDVRASLHRADAEVESHFLLVFAPFFTRVFAALMYRIRGAGPTPPGTEYESATIPLTGNVFWSASTSFVEAPGGRSGTPAPRSTGTTATSTVSTSPASRSERKRTPPP